MKGLANTTTRATPRRALGFLLGLALSVAARGAEPSAELQLHRLDGAAFALASLKGHVVVLDFWATWCVPCRASVPFFNGLQQKYGPLGLDVVGLTLEEDGDAISDFLDDVPASFLIVRDPTGHAGDAFAVAAMPSTFLLDKQGRVVARFEGSDKRTHAALEQAVKTLVEGGSLPEGTGVRVAKGTEATGALKAWERGYLADPIMSLDGTTASRIFKEHVHASKEGAAGDGGASGGGCGCN